MMDITNAVAGRTYSINDQVVVVDSVTESLVQYTNVELAGTKNLTPAAARGWCPLWRWRYMTKVGQIKEVRGAYDKI